MLRLPNPADRRALLALALPILGAMASQNLLNLVDTAMVGGLGDASLAAAGAGNFANFLATAFVMGLATGVQTMASRRKGEGRSGEMAVPLNGGILLAAVLGIPVTLVCWALAPHLVGLISPDAEVVALGVPYLRVRLLAVIATGINFAFRGYWNGTDESRFYMLTLLFMHGVNVVLNWAFIGGHLGLPELGVVGSATATTIAVHLGTLAYLTMGWLRSRNAGFAAGIPAADTLRTMLVLAVPSGVQQLFFAGGMTALFLIFGRLGTAEQAAANVLINLTLVMVLPGMAFGMAAATQVSQSLGAKDPQGADRRGREAAGFAAMVVGSLGLLGVFFPELLLRVFIAEDATVALAAPALRLVAVMVAVDTWGMVLMNALLGAGDSRRVMAVSLGLQWGFMIPTAWFAGIHLGAGLIGVWICQVVYRLIQALIFGALWRQGRWKAIRV